jgi:hypothetical protein
MLRTYKAVLRGDRLEWCGDAPQVTAPEHPVMVHVTLLDEPETEEARSERGRRMAEALERLAARNAFAEIEDPVEWQRDIRKDRPLPGREE